MKIVQVKQVNSSSAKYPAVVPLPGNKKNDYKVNKQNDCPMDKQNDCPMNKQNDCRMSLQQENNNHS